jgi:hypothetical protein
MYSMIGTAIQVLKDLPEESQNKIIRAIFLEAASTIPVAEAPTEAPQKQYAVTLRSATEPHSIVECCRTLREFTPVMTLRSAKDFVDRAIDDGCVHHLPCGVFTSEATANELVSRLQGCGFFATVEEVE